MTLTERDGAVAAVACFSSSNDFSLYLAGCVCLWLMTGTQDIQQLQETQNNLRHGGYMD